MRVTDERRRKQEFAEAVRYLSEDTYPAESEKIRMVVDNLSTHSPAVQAASPSDQGSG